MDPIKTKFIKILDIKDIPTRSGATMVSVTDDEGTSYTFFKTKQDGTASKAFESGKNVQVGDEIEIAYKVVVKETGKTYRNVLYFKTPQEK